MSGMTFKKLGAEVHNGASVSAGDDILAAQEAPRHGILHVGVSLDTATPVQLEITSPGAVAELVDLEGGANLVAGVGYWWPWPVIQGYSYALVNKSTGSASGVRHAVFLLETPV